MFRITTESGGILLLQALPHSSNGPEFHLVIFENAAAEPEDMGPVVLADPVVTVGSPVRYQALLHQQLPSEDFGNVVELVGIGNSLRADNR